MRPEQPSNSPVLGRLRRWARSWVVTIRLKHDREWQRQVRRSEALWKDWVARGCPEDELVEVPRPTDHSDDSGTPSHG